MSESHRVLSKPETDGPMAVVLYVKTAVIKCREK